ncbi:MAG: ABC transporter ATP-binding protein [Oscillospiraceae bacterium]|nr:ABC transporter ATP-binding protein [Oscillospiraceae bacterium]
MSETLLSIENISVNYGHITALIDASIEAKKGQIVSIIGSNGAGKTTLLRTISGLVRPKHGNIMMDGREIIGMKPNKIVELGVTHVPEGRKVFSGLTVRDNLLVGGYLYSGAKLQKTLDETFELFPILKEREKQFAGTLSGGEQQMLAIGRGMMAHPKIMLLDEPSLGLAPIIISNVFNYIRTIRDSGVTILLVEQNAKKALETCDIAYVLENGRITLSGTGSELLHSPAVVAAYLGEQRK